jgi:transposase
MTGVSASEVGKVRRRHRSEEERRRIVAESFEPGASVSVVARRHDVNTNLLFTWRRRYGTEDQGSCGSATFVPARITNDAMPQAPAPAQAVAVSIAGRMEIELPGGCRLIAGNDVDTAVLGRVIRVLLHR